MRLKDHPCPGHADRCALRGKSAFTLMEMLVTLGLGTLLISMAVTSVVFTSRSASGITAQTTVNQRAAYAIELIQSRIRLATLVSNDSSGNTLTLGFDTNNLVDSGNGGNGVAWANQDYFEQFKFVGVNSTNAQACATNQLIYIPNTASSNNSRVLISAGMRNLPGHNIFFTTNSVLVTICFGVVDTNPQDYFQETDIQSMGASLNRPPANNMLTIMPAP